MEKMLSEQTKKRIPFLLKILFYEKLFIKFFMLIITEIFKKINYRRTLNEEK